MPKSYISRNNIKIHLVQLFFALFPDTELQLLILQAILLPGTANVNDKHQRIALNMVPRTDF